MKPDIRYVIYATGHRKPDQYPRCYVPVFAQADEARSWLTKFLAGKPHRFEGGDILLDTDFPIRLRSQQWSAIMAAPIGKDIPTDQANLILRFKYGVWDETHIVEAIADEVDNRVGGAIIAKRAPKPDRTPKAQRPDGYVTITELCAASSTPAMLARAALRASGRAKPEYGWAFPANEIPAIKKLCGIG